MESKIVSDTSYQLSNFYPITQEKLFKSFFDAGVLVKIWGLNSIIIDARVGGKCFAKAEFKDENWDFVLTYKEIIPHEKIMYVLNFKRHPKKEFRVTLIFKRDGNGTEVIEHAENFEGPLERDGHLAAWKWALAGLGEVITE